MTPQIPIRNRNRLETEIKKSQVKKPEKPAFALRAVKRADPVVEE